MTLNKFFIFFFFHIKVATNHASSKQIRYLHLSSIGLLRKTIEKTINNFPITICYLGFWRTTDTKYTIPYKLSHEETKYLPDEKVKEINFFLYINKYCENKLKSELCCK